MSSASAQAQPGLTARAQKSGFGCTGKHARPRRMRWALVSVPASGGSPATSRLRTVLEAAWPGTGSCSIHPTDGSSTPLAGVSPRRKARATRSCAPSGWAIRPRSIRCGRWTASHLEGGGGSPFASLWSNGRIADHDSATDADSDIALALLLRGAALR